MERNKRCLCMHVGCDVHPRSDVRLRGPSTKKCTPTPTSQQQQPCTASTTAAAAAIVVSKTKGPFVIIAAPNVQLLLHVVV